MNVALHTIECFAGVGMLGIGLHAGLRHMGIETRTVCYVEREAFAASVMAARMAEGALDDAPVWTDVTSFDATAWRGSVDCVIGGFPCQDLSLAGRRAGLDGKRSGLFFDLLRIAEDSGARYLFLENVAGIASATATVVDEAEGELEERAAARVLGELADRGWNAEWLTLSASDVGASHGRARWFCWAWRMGDSASVGSDVQHGTAMQRGRTGDAEQAGMGGGNLGNTECPRRPATWGGHAQHAGREPEPRCSDVGHTPSQRCGETRECGAPAGNAGSGGPVAGMADPEGDGWDEGRAEPGGIEGRPDAAECCGAVAHTERNGQRTSRRPGLHCSGEQGPQPDQQSRGMANAGSTGLQEPELGTTRPGNRGGQERHGPVSELRGAYAAGLFAPGPTDARWAAILAAEPWRAPAIDKEAESVFHGMADGMARGLEFSNRAARLKCCGNGVVPLQAAAAAVVLVRRMIGRTIEPASGTQK